MFKKHWTSTGSKNGAKLNWYGTWQNWVWKEPALKGGALARPCYMNAHQIDEKGKARGFEVPTDKVEWQAFRRRVYEAEGITEEMLRAAQIDYANIPGGVGR